MSPKYIYWFATGPVEVEVDDELYETLTKMDRKERNDNITHERKSFSIDKFDFETSFLVYEEEAFKTEPSESPAYLYAMNRLTPLYQDILKRRLLYHEQFPKIAAELNTTVSALCHYYHKAKKRFEKYYKDAEFIFSLENRDKPEADRIKHIPFGLTPQLVLDIRTLRKKCKTIPEIAEQLSLRENQVSSCLRFNPVLETACQFCGKPIQQSPTGTMQRFCRPGCYYMWFRREGMLDNPYRLKKNGKEYITHAQKIAIDFYRQLHVSTIQISKIVGISETFVSAHAHASPVPYVNCLECGEAIDTSGANRIPKYCSKKCRDRFNQKVKDARRDHRYHGIEPDIPTLEHITLAVELRTNGASYHDIEVLAGLTKKNVDTLFRFHSTMEKICPWCDNPFMTAIVTQAYCSEECKEQAKNKRRTKRRRREKREETKSDKQQ